MRPLFVLSSLFVLASAAQAALELPALFSDHAVIQRNQQAPVWGWADPGQKVTVTLAGQTATATADAQGRWRVNLENLQGTGPQTLTVTAGGETKTAKDILLGEVWLGSGQSNMAMTVNRAQDYEKEQAAAQFPELRMFVEKSAAATAQQDRCKGQWLVCTPATVGGFSATAYFFGRELHQKLKAPVGLINSSVGGTPIESWISPEAQAASPELKGFFELAKKAEADFDPVKAKALYEKQRAAWLENAKKAKAAGKPVPRAPRDPIANKERKGNVGGLFNGKIASLIPYAIRGVIWYQGEANSNGAKASFYQQQISLLAKDWRTRWGYEFPIAWVQLPNYQAGRDDGWMRVREGMLKAAQTVPNAGMAVTLDVGEAKDIHPKNKQAVGRRLAIWALSQVYGQEGPKPAPLPVKHEIKDSSVVVTYTGPVLYKSGGDSGWVIAGADKAWHPATVEVKDNTVVLTSKAVPQPVAARYAWAEMPVVTMWSTDGLPVTQYRTDEW